MGTARTTFAILCIVGIVAITVGALLEGGRFRRGESVIGRRQFRLRMVSAVVWVSVLAVNCYAVTRLWPPSPITEATKPLARHFLWAIAGGFSLLLVALFLLLFDVLSLSRERQRYALHAEADFIAKARQEVAAIEDARRR